MALAVLGEELVWRGGFISIPIENNDFNISTNTSGFF